MEHVKHEITPIYDKDSKILILGSFPSVKSREANFFYHHPQNRFWKLLSSLCGEECPQTVTDKKSFLLRNHIAVWDVIASCEIEGSSDSSIKNVIPNNFQELLSTANILQIFCNGTTSYNLYKKHVEKLTAQEAIKLPSTSPANAAFSLQKLEQHWAIIKNYL